MAEIWNEKEEHLGISDKGTGIYRITKRFERIKECSEWGKEDYQCGYNRILLN